MNELELIGRGIYSVSEASRLTRVSPQRIRRWLRGYRYVVDKEPKWSGPVWQGDLPKIDGATALSFLDLMEVHFVNAFREHGVSWKSIRLAAERSRQMFNTNHPFAAERFVTDGRTIFADILQVAGQRRTLDLVRNQYAFRQVLSPSFIKSLDFSSMTGEAVRWWPMGKRRSIILDPAISFGQPIVEKEAVPTAVLANAYRVEESVHRVARLFSVRPGSVRDAIAFEDRLAA